MTTLTKNLYFVFSDKFQQSPYEDKNNQPQNSLSSQIEKDLPNSNRANNPIAIAENSLEVKPKQKKNHHHKRRNRKKNH